MNKALNRLGEFVGNGRGAGLLVGVTLLTLFAARGLLFPGMGGDEGEQLVFSQYFDWGYQVRNPPLFTWLVIAVTKAIGISVYSVITIKLAALLLSYFFLWKSAQIILDDDRLAALVAVSPLALYYVAWDSIYGYSHSVLVMTFYMATLCLVLRITEAPRTRDFIWLGFVIGGGLLSKYVFVLFLIALLSAIALDRNLRQNLFRPTLLISLAIAALVLAPHIIWLALNVENPAGGSIDSYSIKSLLRLLLAIVGFLSPLWLILIILFPTAVKAKPGSSDRRWARLLEHYFLILCGAAVIAILTLKMDRLRTHYLFILLPMIIYFFLKIKTVIAPLPRLQLYGGVMVVFAAVSVLGMIIKFIGEPLKCSRCQHHIPYADLANKLNKAGFVRGTVFAYWHPDPIAGNLRVWLSDSRVISAKHPKVQPPLNDRTGQCLLVWALTENDVGREATIAMANRYLGTSIAINTPSHQVDAPLVMGNGKRAELGYILIEPGQGTCR